MEETLDTATRIVKNNAPKEGGDIERVPPLVYTCPARGGKTTFLFELFKVLKDFHNMAPVSDIDALRMVVDEDALVWRHIHRTSKSRPVVLLIGEINKLGMGAL
jgi:tRNA uridine 5-carbamoylmethylation protein Kti12